MTAPVAFGVGIAVGAVLVVLAEAVILWLHIWRAERQSTQSPFPDPDRQEGSLDLPPTRPR